MEPLPTPYDIAPLPQFAYSPGLLVWLLLILVLLVGAFAIILSDRRGHGRVAASAIRQALAELDLCAQSLDSRSGEDLRHTLFRASLLARRLLAVLHDPSVVNLSPAELAAWAERTALPAPIARLARQIPELEALKFAPQLDPARCRAALDELRARITERADIQESSA